MADPQTAAPGGTQRLGEVVRLDEVMRRLRRECPWDAEQTHRSLVTYLVEETGEVVDAIEQDSLADLREELGDLLLQVVFHCEIERQRGGFDLDDVARDITDKLVRRHPYVFGDADVPEDLDRSWEQRKRDEKQRTSALDGIPASLDPLARAQKVVSRARRHGVGQPVDDLLFGDRVSEDRVPNDSSASGSSSGAALQPDPAPGGVDLSADAAGIGREILALVARASDLGIDVAQATRDALRSLEQQVADAEQR